MIAAIWILTLLGLLCWTLLAAGLHALLGADPGWLGAFGEWLARVPGAEWLKQIWPDWHRVALWLLQGLQGALGWAGTAALWVVWIVWAGGTGLALLAAGALHLMARGGQRAMQEAARRAEAARAGPPV